MPWQSRSNPKSRRPIKRAIQVEPRFTPPDCKDKQIPRIAGRFVVHKPPDIKSHQGQREEANRNVYRPIDPGSVQDAKQPDKRPGTDHEQHDRPALKDPDTGPTLSRIVVRMHLEHSS